MDKVYDKITIEIVNALFKELFAIKPGYKAAFETQEDLLSSKRQWMLAFEEQNIKSIEKLRNGFKSLRKNPSPFFPSPGDFLELCKSSPSDIGAPSLDAAYKEACEKAHPCYGEKKWSHDAVKHAYLKTEPYSLRTESAFKSKPAFEAAYLEACEDYADGKNLNQIESKGKDTQENRMAYQEYWGYLTQQRKYSKTPDDIVILTYQQWLDLKCQS